MVATDYQDIAVEVSGQIGIFNRPDFLNAFGGRLLPETINAFRELNKDPDTFSIWSFQNRGLELVRTIIDHSKIFVLAFNGPAVGGGAAWFLGLADTILAADSCHLQAPFSSLALVPENGSIRTLSHSLGIHRANDILIYGKRVTAQQLHTWGTVSELFPTTGFLSHVKLFLEKQLDDNDAKSMMVAKKLQATALRNERLLAAYDAMDALNERLVEEKKEKRSKL
ncbi:peroxisomal D3,D2-enoyl-CoA isomerase [Akanthomyces lecanii RCEF 1005]|uniref:Peroxisomal D3,D2-enoyl-CoA isomerase n=1 Tax=Akanthomyces lecanii RCEF 1005 TaxID=1081108 RepID=A0A167ZQH5_CORDF|nr:peroxisomal D3,D2-enoyl-CoA isomerase [Akanthomyces lecanii RCEF 1005]